MVAGRAQPILVFPEGTTHNSKVMITFKDGAFAPGLPVQPALLRYKYTHCDPSWVWSGPEAPMLMFKLMCQLVNSLEVEFLPVCSPSQEEMDNPIVFARNVQLKMAEAMGVPTTEHSVEDLQLQVAAIKASFPAEVGVIGYSAIKDAFGVDAAQIKDQMLVFKHMQGGAAGRVSCEEFVESFERAFHKPSKNQTRMLQEFFDRLTDGQPTLAELQALEQCFQAGMLRCDSVESNACDMVPTCDASLGSCPRVSGKVPCTCSPGATRASRN